MKKNNVFSLMGYVPWLCLLFFLSSCDLLGGIESQREEMYAVNENYIRFKIEDATTKEDLINYLRPGGIYLASKMKLLKDGGTSAKEFEVHSDAAGDYCSFRYADSTDLDAATKMKTKFFYLKLEDLSGNKDTDTIQVDFKFKNGGKLFEKTTIYFNGKINQSDYSNASILTFFKKI